MISLVRESIIFMKKFILQILGHFFLGLGIIGAMLPILPTTPFLLLAVFCYSKSNLKLHAWLMKNRYFGPALEKWFEHGIINFKGKIFASIMIGFVLVIKIPKIETLMIIKIILVLILISLITFIWTRPSEK